MPSWMFKEESNREETKSLKEEAIPVQENDNHATQDVQEGTREEKCVAGPMSTRSQAKKSDKIHPLKVYHRRSSEEGFYSEEML